MRNWILRWIVNVIALILVTFVVPGIVLETKHLLAPLLAVALISFAISFIRPIVLFFAWPVNCMTFGLLGFALNVAFFWFAGSGVIKGFVVTGPMPALLGSLGMGAVSSVLNFFLKDRATDG